MIERDESVGAMAIRCDRCTNMSDDYNIDDFKRMIDDAKEAGWKIERDHRAEGGWSHTCPDHTGKNRIEEQRKLLGL